MILNFLVWDPSNQFRVAISSNMLRNLSKWLNMSREMASRLGKLIAEQCSMFLLYFQAFCGLGVLPQALFFPVTKTPYNLVFWYICARTSKKHFRKVFFTSFVPTQAIWREVSGTYTLTTKYLDWGGKPKVDASQMPPRCLSDASQMPPKSCSLISSP